MDKVCITSRDRKGADRLALNEGIIGYDGEHYVLLGRQEGMEEQVLMAGDVLELGANGCRRVVRVASGGYRGWYYVTASGRRARFALCMQARLLTRSA